MQLIYHIINYKSFVFLKSDQKVVCYFQSWAVYRPKPLDFDIKDIDPFACTHIIYAFAGIHKENFTIMSLDEDRDVLQGTRILSGKNS